MEEIEIGNEVYYKLHIWSGKYSSQRGWVLERNYIKARYLQIKWSIMEIPRVIRLNVYHWGNPFCFGSKLTDELGRKNY